MNDKRRREIGEIANSIRESLELTVPVDVASAAELLGGKLIEAEDGVPEAYVEPDGDGFVIGLDSNIAENRQRFSIAHELGHLFLHMGYLADDAKWGSMAGRYEDSIRYRFGYSEEEYEAHEFAGAFLMPEGEFRDIAELNCVENRYRINEIAKHFQVSPDAATMRGRWLKLFAWE